MNDNRVTHLCDLYALLDELRVRVGGFRTLQTADGRMRWPGRGVYFFLDDQEPRLSGDGPRVVRVGTHALRLSSSTLWGRLSQHRGHVGGSYAGGGNHRGSVFRLHVGTALLNRDGYPDSFRATWAKGSTASTSLRRKEHLLEVAVSAYIRRLFVLWVDVPDAPSPLSERGIIEANAIALLSNTGKATVDPPSVQWLGNYADREPVRRSGLWNVNHVSAGYDPRFLDVLTAAVKRTTLVA